MIDKIIPRSLLSKLVLAGSSVQILMLGLVLWYNVQVYERAIEEYVQMETLIIAPLLNAALSQFVFQRDDAAIQAVLNSLSDTKLRFLEVYDGNGERFAATGNPLPAPATTAQSLPGITTETSRKLRLGEETVGEVRFGLNSPLLADWHTRLLFENIMLITRAMLLTALTMGLMGYGLIVRIKSLLRYTQAITAGDYLVKADEAGNDELGQLAVELNRMNMTLSDRNEALRHSEQRFRDFARSGSDWFWELDSELRMMWLSENFEQFSGMRREKFMVNLPVIPIPRII
jgi:PAS domain-containing protein